MQVRPDPLRTKVCSCETFREADVSHSSQAVAILLVVCALRDWMLQDADS